MKFTAAKAWVAGIGNTLAALQIFLGIVLLSVEDDTVSVEEVAPLVTGFLTMAVTIYGVWKKPNQPKPVGT